MVDGKHATSSKHLPHIQHPNRSKRSDEGQKSHRAHKQTTELTLSNSDIEKSPLKKSSRSAPASQQSECLSPKYCLPLAGIFITALVLFIFSLHGKAMDAQSDPLSNPSAQNDLKIKETVEVLELTTQPLPPPTTTNNNNNSKQLRPLSFFGKTKHRFGAVNCSDGSDGSDAFINADQFLEACHDYLTIYKLLGSGMIFNMITKDVNGNIVKLEGWRTKYNKEDLLGIVQVEIDDGTTGKSNSATDALLWLKRGLWMMYHFFEEIVASEAKTPGTEAFQKAYNSQLAPHHNFIIKGIIRSGLKTTSMSVKDFVDKVCAYKVSGDSGDTCHGIADRDAKTKVVLREIAAYIAEMQKLLNIINKFYEDKKLEP